MAKPRRVLDLATATQPPTAAGDDVRRRPPPPPIVVAVPGLEPQQELMMQWALAQQVENERLRRHAVLLQQALFEVQSAGAAATITCDDTKPPSTPRTSTPEPYSGSVSMPSSPASAIGMDTPTMFDLPPGLFRPPPGLPPPPGLARAVPQVNTPSSNSSPLHDEPDLAAVGVDYDSPRIWSDFAVGQPVCSTTAEWIIQDPHRKLRTSAGFPLVSPFFDVNGFSEVKLIFSAGAAWSADHGSRNRQKNKAAAANGQMPEHGSLKIKVVRDAAEEIESPEIYLRVGRLRLGPLFTDSLAEMPVQGIDIPSDWRQELQEDASGFRFLRVAIETVRGATSEVNGSSLD